MRKYIQRYLGIEQLMLSNVMLTSQLNELKYKLASVLNQTANTNIALADIIVKMGFDEFSETRQANSDAIANIAADRAWAEAAARNHTTGDPIGPRPAKG